MDNLTIKAAAQLMDASGMLRMEAREWRNRKQQMPLDGEWTPRSWAEKCERIAITNEQAATSFLATAKAIAEAVAA